ncbi:MAG: hypothetical protein JST30_06940 [Armatimonadetes bacterium]|nr:hypothetical protein [Armatimonadota bacterium]
MSRTSLLAVVALFGAAACTPPSSKGGAAVPSKPASRAEKLAGSWSGKAPESEDKARTGTESNFLAEQLGGYRIELQADGSFSSSWRGLTKDGTWAIDGDTLVLKIEKVLGKTRGETKAADSPLFDQDTRLEITDGDQTLKLSQKDGNSLPLQFKRD